MARQATGLLAASYKPSRADLLKDERFRSSFENAKAQLRAMDLRLVEEPDTVRQALLEIYVAVVLKTPYNDFGIIDVQQQFLDLLNFERAELVQEIAFDEAYIDQHGQVRILLEIGERDALSFTGAVRSA